MSSSMKSAGFPTTVGSIFVEPLMAPTCVGFSFHFKDDVYKDLLDSSG
jgi:hypothetical protein